MMGLSLFGPYEMAMPAWQTCNFNRFSGEPQMFNVNFRPAVREVPIYAAQC